MWIPSHHHSPVPRSRETIARALDQLQALGVNAVLPAVWNRGHTAWPSVVMEGQGLPRQDPELAGFDPLAAYAELAAERGMALIPWLEYGFAAEPVGRPGPLLARYPGWAALDRRGRVLEHGGLRWLNALNPAVQAFVATLLVELAERYPLAGLQGDDRIALPRAGSHDAATRARFHHTSGGGWPWCDGDPRWCRFRRDAISAWVAASGERLRAQRPGLLWSLAPAPLPFGRRQLMQDSVRWLADGQVDLLVPQLYHRRVGAVERRLATTLRALPPARHRQVLLGLSLRVRGRPLQPIALERMGALVERRGLGGICLFHHGWLALSG